MKKITVRIATAGAPLDGKVNFEAENDDFTFKPRRALKSAIFKKVVKSARDTGGEIVFEGEAGIKFKPSKIMRSQANLKAGQNLAVSLGEAGEVVFTSEDGSISFKAPRALKNAVSMTDGDVVVVSKSKESPSLLIFEGEDGMGFRPSKALRKMMYA
jgi:nucleoid DNA-binding protein